MLQKLRLLVEFVRNRFAGNADGHGADHTMRVMHYAAKLCKLEGGNILICVVAALLHDVDDSKLFTDSHCAEDWLINNMPEIKDEVLDVIDTLSYHKNLIPHSLNGFIVQDADRLDALGRIGVIRAFKYGNKHGRTQQGTVDFIKGERGLGLMVHTHAANKIAEELKKDMIEEILNQYPKAKL